MGCCCISREDVQKKVDGIYKEARARIAAIEAQACADAAEVWNNYEALLESMRKPNTPGGPQCPTATPAGAHDREETVYEVKPAAKPHARRK